MRSNRHKIIEPDETGLTLERAFQCATINPNQGSVNEDVGAAEITVNLISAFCKTGTFFSHVFTLVLSELLLRFLELLHQKHSN